MFARWVRPDDITNNPTMIYTVSSFSIKQVSCSSRDTLLQQLPAGCGSLAQKGIPSGGRLSWLLISDSVTSDPTWSNQVLAVAVSSRV